MEPHCLSQQRDPLVLTRLAVPCTHDAGRGVVRAVVELGDDWVVEAVVSLDELLQALRVEGSHGLAGGKAGRGEEKKVGRVENLIGLRIVFYVRLTRQAAREAGRA